MRVLDNQNNNGVLDLLHHYYNQRRRIIYIHQILTSPIHFNSDFNSVNYWPGMPDTAFLVIFTDACEPIILTILSPVHKTFHKRNGKSFPFLSTSSCKLTLKSVFVFHIKKKTTEVSFLDELSLSNFSFFKYLYISQPDFI